MSRIRRGSWFTAKKKKQKKQGETLMDAYRYGLAEDLRDLGKTEEEIEAELERWDSSAKAQEARYSIDETQDKNNRIEVRVQYPVEDLCKHTSWKSMDKKARRGLLWGLGFNTKKYDYYIEERVYTKLDGVSRGYGEVVYGQERLDKEWLNQRDSGGRRVASDAAIIYVDRKRDQGFREDIDNISNEGSLWDAAVKMAKGKYGG